MALGKSYLDSGKFMGVQSVAEALEQGRPFVIGCLVAIPLTDIAQGANGTVSIMGRHTVPKMTGEYWTPGDKLGWDDSAGYVRKTFTPASGDVLNCAVASYHQAETDDPYGRIQLCPGMGEVV